MLQQEQTLSHASTARPSVRVTGMPSAASLFLRPAAAVLRESDITWRAIRSDYTATLVPITLFTMVAASKAPHVSLQSMVVAFALGMVYALPFIAQFAYASQLYSVEEDRIEKPFRPQPAGLITQRGGAVRYVAWVGIYFLVGWWLGLLEWVVLWSVCTAVYSFFRLHEHWLGKNLVAMSCGTVAELGAAWEIVHGELGSAPIWYWVLGMALWNGVMDNIQDFRDVEGDIESGRKTLPIVLGSEKARWVMAVASLGVGIVTFLALRSLASTPLATFVAAVLLAWHVVVLFRVIRYRTREADDSTFKYYVLLLYCAILASGFIFL